MTPEERKQRDRERAKAYYEANREKCIAQRKAWAEKNRERVRANQQRWVEENAERSREIKRQWNARNREQVRTINQAYYVKNADRLKAKNKLWRERNPQKWAAIINANKGSREARRRNAPNYKVTSRDLLRLLSSPCRVTGCTNTDIQIDHVVPLARGGSHGIGNLQPLCGHHNASKNDRLWIEFLNYLRFKTACEMRSA